MSRYAEVHNRMLQAVHEGNVTWHERSDGRLRIRLWASESEYRLLTPAERRHLAALVSDGRVRRFVAGGVLYGRGAYELDPRWTTRPTHDAPTEEATP